jgi:tetratricopeptide (TPR) repeat protein
MNRFLLVIITVIVLTPPLWAEPMTIGQMHAALDSLKLAITQNPKVPLNYVKRGDIYYQLNEQPLAVADYSTALTLDDTQDNAYFGRGMAYGRMGKINEGIADLSVYIKRHPDSSVAYTKRGVRNIWRRNLQAAEHDLSRAIALDPENAEAHDDLGVVNAQQQRFGIAATHFSTAIKLDPTYQKAYHNLAMCYYIAGHPQQALEEVNSGLNLDPDNRNSLLLKATILQEMGKASEARKIAEQAEFLPESNWTERSAIGGIAK